MFVLELQNIKNALPSWKARGLIQLVLAWVVPLQLFYEGQAMINYQVLDSLIYNHYTNVLLGKAGHNIQCEARTDTCLCRKTLSWCCHQTNGIL